MTKYFKKTELIEICRKHLRDTGRDIQMFRVLEDEDNLDCSYAYFVFWFEMYKNIRSSMYEYLPKEAVNAFATAAFYDTEAKTRDKYWEYIELAKTMLEVELQKEN